MENIIEILMKRDGITRQEAEDLINETCELIMEASAEGNDCEAEDILMENLGLEPDYLFDLL